MITINLEKAKQIAHAKRRELRAAEFAPYDDLVAKRIPGSDDVESARQAIRDKYAVMQNQIDAAKSADELRALLQAKESTVRVFKQVLVPNPDIACTPGMCLEYVQNTFGVAPKYPTAIAAWEASKYKHSDQDFPDSVWVPIWFTFDNDPNGHVALRESDGSIWSASHPVSTIPTHHSSIADIERYYGGKLTYLGWTEDIEDTLVVK